MQNKLPKELLKVLWKVSGRIPEETTMGILEKLLQQFPGKLQNLKEIPEEFPMELLGQLLAALLEGLSEEHPENSQNNF